MFNYQEAFKNFADVNAIQENLSKFYDVESIQENLKAVYDLDAVKENFAKLLDTDVANTVKEAFEQAIDQEAITATVEKNAKLASDLINTNTNVVADAVILQSVQLREGVEKALKQADVLAGSKDLAEAFETQKAFAQEAQESLRDLAWSNVGILTNAVEANVNLVKDAFAKPVAKKATARKAPVAKKVEAAA